MPSLFPLTVAGGNDDADVDDPGADAASMESDDGIPAAILAWMSLRIDRNLAFSASNFLTSSSLVLSLFFRSFISPWKENAVSRSNNTSDVVSHSL